MSGLLSRRAFLAAAAGAAAGPGALLAGRPPGARSRWDGYERAIVVDALAGLDVFNVPYPAEGVPDAAVVEAARASGITAINLTVGVVGNRPEPFERTVEDLARREAFLTRHPGTFLKVLGADDVARAKETGRLGVVYGFQDTVMLEGRPERLDLFHGLGVRVVQLTYNDRNLVGDGCLEPGDAGLSRHGVEIVERMAARGMLVDLSHCGTRTTREAILASERPVSATHTGCRAVYDHPRNKRDEELRLLADRGGVVGVYLMPFLNARGAPRTADVVAHLEHALRVCGEDHVGVGSDQAVVPVHADAGYRAMVEATVEERMRRGISAPREDTPPFVPELNHPRRLERVADALLARGHAERVVEKVVGENWLRLFREVWTPPA